MLGVKCGGYRSSGQMPFKSMMRMAGYAKEFSCFHQIPTYTFCAMIQSCELRERKGITMFTAAIR